MNKEERKRKGDFDVNDLAFGDEQRNASVNMASLVKKNRRDTLAD